MRYLSLFSGIEAASCAWEPLGWTPVAFAEIEPFPCSLLAHRWPNVPNLGDVSAIADEQIAALGPIDVVIGGSPCQDLSVAGKRAGLVGARSSLFHEQVRIFHAARHLCGARWFVWENVPGAFSSHGGRDFALVVGALAGCELPVPGDGWGTEGVALGKHGLVEWAVLDAQWFGLAQRRRRVFAVLDAGDWAGRAPVLLERESLRGDTAPRREAGEGVAGSISSRVDRGGVNSEGGDGHLVAHALSADGFDASEDGTGRGVPLVPDVAWALQERDAKGCDSSTKDGHLIPVAFDTTQVTSAANYSNPQPGDPCHPLAAGAHIPAVVFNWQAAGTQTTLGANTLGANTLGANTTQAIATATHVRRLTPRECERLQGFPDDWTATPHRGKPAADGPRYRALGNSMAVPVVAWIGRQIAAVAG